MLDLHEHACVLAEKTWATGFPPAVFPLLPCSGASLQRIKDSFLRRTARHMCQTLYEFFKAVAVFLRVQNASFCAVFDGWKMIRINVSNCLQFVRGRQWLCTTEFPQLLVGRSKTVR